MAGVNIKYNDESAKRLIKDLLKKTTDLKPVFKSFGEYMLRRTEDCFRKQKDPWGERWKKLKPVTWAQKKNDKILTETTALRRGIHYDVDLKSITISTGTDTKDYAAIHQFGGKAGRNLSAKIPARPYLAITEEDEQEFIRLTMEHFDL